MKAGWEVRPLGDLCELYQPKTITKKDMTHDGPYPVFGANGIIGRYHEFNHAESQLMIGCRGACGTVNVSMPNSWITGNSMVVRPKDGRVYRDFLRYFFYGPARLETTVTGAAQPQITRQSLSPVPVPLPPLEEQQRIVAVLDEAFEGLARARANTEANLQNARELYGRCRDALLENGNGWEEVMLGDLLDNITYGFTNPMPDADDGPYKITAKNVNGGRIDYKTARRTTCEAFSEVLTDKSRPKIGDVLLTKDGTLGRTAVVDQDNICINQSVAVMRPNSRVFPEYLSELLACSRHQEAMIADAGGTTIKHLYITRVPKITVEIPELPEQIRLTEILQALRSRCLVVEESTIGKLQDLAELRQSLLQKAFAGELS